MDITFKTDWQWSDPNGEYSGAVEVLELDPIFDVRAMLWAPDNDNGVYYWAVTSCQPTDGSTWTNVERGTSEDKESAKKAAEQIVLYYLLYNWRVWSLVLGNEAPLRIIDGQLVWLGAQDF